MADTPYPVESDNDSQIGAPLVPEVSEQEAGGQEPEPSNDEILALARERFELAKEAETEIRRLALEDQEFLSGKQWPDAVQQERERDSRPCLVVNRLPQFVQQVTNDQRQNRPCIKIHPVDSAATKNTADVIQGLIRHVESRSNAETAYDTASEAAVESSFGYFRILSEFESPESFNQELRIKRIRNAFSVFLDPYAEEPDGSDASFGFIMEDVSPESYRKQYPDSDLGKSHTSDWVTLGNDAPGWIRSDGVRVAEYFTREHKEATIHLLKTGETVRQEKLLERTAAGVAAGLDVSVVRTRKTQIPVIKWYKINGLEILDHGTCPGSFIPIVPVYGKERFINGKRVLESLIRHAKDPQRMLNYWKSAETESIALAPRAPFIGAEGQFEGHPEWETANRRNHAYLEYKPTTIAGQPAPPPQRQAFEPAVQAISQASMGAAEDLKATTGIYATNPEQDAAGASGIAIQRRNSQVQTSNFHFVDNFNRALKHAGRILLEWIPSIYDAERAARIIGEDGEQKVVLLNQKHKDESGKEVLYDLSVGRYDVTVATGPSYASKREEASASMMEFSRAVPAVAEAASDLIVKNQDWPGADGLAERLQKYLQLKMPGLITDSKQAQIPPQVQAMLSQQGQMLDAMKKELDEATKVIETKKLELDHKERVEMMRLQQEAEITMAKLGSQESMALLKHQIAEIENRLQYLNMAAPIGAPNTFDPEQADGGNYAGVGHIGGGANIPGGETPGIPTGGQSPGQSMEGN